jgi:ankyrin repeat protein
VRALLVGGATFQTQEHTQGMNALMLAAIVGCPATVRALLERGADANDRDAAGLAVLNHAVYGE